MSTILCNSDVSMKTIVMSFFEREKTIIDNKREFEKKKIPKIGKLQGEKYNTVGDIKNSVSQKKIMKREISEIGIVLKKMSYIGYKNRDNP